MGFSVKMGAALFVALLLAWGCEQKTGQTEEAAAQEEEREYPSQEGWNSQLYITRAGHKQAVLQYGHMRQFEKRKVILFDQGVEVDFFNREGQHTSNLIAERGEYNEQTEDVRGMGNVVVVSDSGLTLHTEEIHWDNEKGRIFSDTLVMLTSLDFDTLYGKAFESNADLTRRVIYEPWGVSNERVDFNELEESFAAVPDDSSEIDTAIVDSLAPLDSTEVPRL